MNDRLGAPAPAAGARRRALRADRPRFDGVPDGPATAPLRRRPTARRSARRHRVRDPTHDSVLSERSRDACGDHAAAADQMVCGIKSEGEPMKVRSRIACISAAVAAFMYGGAQRSGTRSHLGCRPRDRTAVQDGGGQLGHRDGELVRRRPATTSPGPTPRPTPRSSATTPTPSVGTVVPHNIDFAERDHRPEPHARHRRATAASTTSPILRRLAHPRGQHHQDAPARQSADPALQQRPAQPDRRQSHVHRQRHRPATPARTDHQRRHHGRRRHHPGQRHLPDLGHPRASTSTTPTPARPTSARAA